MTETDRTQGSRIRNLLSNAQSDVAIIAPFIKDRSLESLLNVIPNRLPIRCVTRWLPLEIAAGVSDPEIFFRIRDRGNATLSLVHNLHAKIYIADDMCLVGSSNVTSPGLGDGTTNNIEVLVESTIHDSGVAQTLSEIQSVERPASSDLCRNVRTIADAIKASEITQKSTNSWFPKSRKPDEAFRSYSSPRTSYLTRADRLVMSDVAALNLPPGLDEHEFRTRLQARLLAIPLARGLIESDGDEIMTPSDAHGGLAPFVSDDYTLNDLWISFATWMAYWFPDQVITQHITQLGLRRAQLLQ